MKHHKHPTLLIMLLLVATSALFAGQAVTTRHFTFTVPDTMEVQVADLKTAFSLQAQPGGTYTYTLQPKGMNTKRIKPADSAYNTITLKVERLSQERDNATFRSQTLAFSEEELLEASKVFENAIRRSEVVRRWYDLSTTEIDGMFTWKYGYETLTGIHAEVYIIHAGDTLISITTRYTNDEQTIWKPVFEQFLASGISFMDSLKPKEIQDNSAREEETTALYSYPLFGSSETFLWDDEPDWRSNSVYLPGQGGKKVHTIKTSTETLQSKGYYCKVSAIEGLKALLASTISRQNYLLQSKRDIEQQLENNTSLKNREVHRNEIDYENRFYVITYTYDYPYGEEAIHGAMIVKITKENVMLQVEVEWFDRGEALASAIIESIMTE
ncbi:hypothetical protein [uncultured Sphaerochaeta sp.]|uniref:hypothetical protein n=1 Tax=uncultured Sphaerochaeta sp. TaxID=886478 RepID=UPI002AA7E49C|nr:hypothetical protein [uncultured Sphaerochaeta sp.]